MKTVSIGYAYATSPHAKTYGFYHVGCYVVDVHDEHGKHTLGGFATFPQAKTRADETGLPYHRWSMQKERG